MKRSEEWVASLKKYQGGDLNKSLFQLLLTLSVYFILMSFMFTMAYLGFSYWLIAAVAVPTAGFHIKIFIIMHDCSHNSYFQNQKACVLVGRLCGVITFTPFFQWKREHAIHHASVSNLEKRGVGDVWTMTVQEYQASSWKKKAVYRIFRSPLFLFTIAPAFLFLIIMRFPKKTFHKKEVLSTMMTDAVLFVIILVFSLSIGFWNYWKVILPVVFLASMGGVWLFYVQHQFKSVYWAHSEDWSSVRAAMEGSSFYNLPGILRWFSGNIGYHHIHHLNPLIPNYKLKQCYKNIPEVQDVTPITLFASLKSAFLTLWDENSGTLVSYKTLHKH